VWFERGSTGGLRGRTSSTAFLAKLLFLEAEVNIRIEESFGEGAKVFILEAGRS